MFKNMLKRSWLSISRKLGRTIILTLIFFMMANLVLAAFIIKSAVSAQMEYAKSTIGGTVSIQADMDAIRESQETKIQNGTDPSKMFMEMDRPSVDVDTANKIASTYTDYIKDYSYEISSSANAGDLQTISTKSPSGAAGMMGGDMNNMMGGPTPSIQSPDAALDSDITIFGVNAYAYVDGVEEGTITIKDGTYFDESSSDSAMISYEFAELNSLQVGDTFDLKNIYTETSIPLTVIGIYDSSSERADANTIYMNTETAAKFLDEDNYNNGNYDVGNVSFYMSNSDNAEEFVNIISNAFPELAENNMKIAVDTSEYDSIASSVESVGSFANTILVIVVIAAVIIVTLIVTINVKDRRYEIGVLMSLGASKKNIIGQIATELLIIGTLGFILASITGSIFADALGNKILESQTASSSEQSERNFGRPGANTSGRPGPMMGGPGSSSSNSSETPNIKDILQAGQDTKKVELDINAQPIDYLLLFITGYLVIILALILPAASIMRYQPKEILTGKE